MVGYWKERQIQERHQGWSFVDDDRMVCAECFEDYAIKDFITDNATETSCSCCGRSAEEEIAAPMNEVLRLIGESLNYEYDDPNDAGLPVEGGEYVFDTMSTREVFEGLETITKNQDVMEEILNAFRDSAWVDKPFYSLAEDDELRYGWRDFVKAVKYERRYLFLKPRPKKGVALADGVPPDEMLDRIGKVINEVGLVREMKAGTQWFRARQHDPAKAYTSAADLGTVPRKYARTSNRMSPAGIPMFYGADDEATAIAETYTPTQGVPTTVTVARFETAREMRVVDLADLSPVPSLFDEERSHLRSGISFLRDFVQDVAKPIKKDGREHTPSSGFSTRCGTEPSSSRSRSSNKRRPRAKFLLGRSLFQTSESLRSSTRTSWAAHRTSPSAARGRCNTRNRSKPGTDRRLGGSSRSTALTPGTWLSLRQQSRRTRRRRESSRLADESRRGSERWSRRPRRALGKSARRPPETC